MGPALTLLSNMTEVDTPPNIRRIGMSNMMIWKKHRGSVRSCEVHSIAETHTMLGDHTCLKVGYLKILRFIMFPSHCHFAVLCKISDTYHKRSLNLPTISQVLLLFLPPLAPPSQRQQPSAKDTPKGCWWIVKHRDDLAKISRGDPGLPSKMGKLPSKMSFPFFQHLL